MLPSWQTVFKYMQIDLYARLRVYTVAPNATLLADCFQIQEVVRICISIKKQIDIVLFTKALPIFSFNFCFLPVFIPCLSKWNC